MVKTGKNKSEIFKKTGATVGVYDASFEVKKVKSLLLWGYQEVGNQPLSAC